MSGSISDIDVSYSSWVAPGISVPSGIMCVSSIGMSSASNAPPSANSSRKLSKALSISSSVIGLLWTLSALEVLAASCKSEPKLTLGCDFSSALVNSCMSTIS